MRRVLAGIVVAGMALAVAPADARVRPFLSKPKCLIAVPNAGTWTAPPDDGLRVANLNVLHGLDDDAPADYPSGVTLDQRIGMQAEQLAAAGVDLLGMQEVSVFRVSASSPVREVASDLAEALAEETGQRWWWCWYLANPYFTPEPDLIDGGGGPISDFEAGLVSMFAGGPYAIFKEGVAVLSRYPIIEKAGLHLPPRLPVEIPLCLVEAAPSLPDDPTAGPLCAATAGFERRSALWTRTATPQGNVDLTATHLAHGITSASNFSTFVQGLAALAWAELRVIGGHPAHAFFTCDCNSEPGDTVPLIPVIEALGWSNTFEGPCGPADTSGCTAGPDKIVFHEATPSRVMTERLDYVFARAGTCTAEPPGGAIIVVDPVAYTDAHGPGWLYPSDHTGVMTDVVPC